MLARMELIHTCYRITDVDRSVAFYTALGFEERKRMPIREEAINVFMGLPGDGDRLELTYNFDTPLGGYDVGTGYGHIAVVGGRSRRHAGRARRAGDRARARAVHRSRRRLPAVLRRRPGRLQGRADRTRRLTVSDAERTEALRDALRSFNEHDLDAIMAHFGEDCVFESPRGPERWGRRFVGKDEVRRGLAMRFEGIPDVELHRRRPFRVREPRRLGMDDQRHHHRR